MGMKIAFDSALSTRYSALFSRKQHMDHVKILKRAWQIITRYRATWVFGIILALTTFSWSRMAPFNGSNSASSQSPPSEIDLGDGYFAQMEADIQRDIDAVSQSINEFFSHDPVPTLIAIGAAVACIGLALLVISTIARYVSETALIKMVDQYEGTGEPGSVRQGFRMGWSRAAWQIFLINLLLDGLLALAFMLALALAFSPLLLLLLGNTAISIISGVAVTGLIFLAIFLAIVAGEVLGLIKLFASRACALGGLSVIDALRHGYDVIRLHLKDVGLMWLLVLGIRIGWPIAMLPIGILSMIVAAILGIIVALLVGLISGLFLKGLTLIVVVASVGCIIFFLVLAIPLAFLDGLQKVFLSSTWTLTYQELRTLDGLAAEQPALPAPEAEQNMADSS
jgi:hypothetical protein